QLGEMLVEEMGCWIGPLEVPLDQLRRLAGPPGAPVMVEVGEDAWRDDVAGLADQVDDGYEPPPVIASWRHDQLRLEDGNHRVEAIRRTGAEQAWTIIGFVDQIDQDHFWAQLAGDQSS